MVPRRLDTSTLTRTRQGFAVRVSGNGITEDVASVEWRFSGEDGSSEGTVSAYLPLSRYENSPATVLAGEPGSLVSVLSGRLQEPAENHWGEPGGAEIWGAYRLMSEQYIPEQVDYRGKLLEDALLDLCRRAGFRNDAVEVKQGKSFIIGGRQDLGEDGGNAGVFPIGTSYLDIANALMESANFVAADLPERIGRIFFPRPRPGATGKVVRSYDIDDYPVGAFSAVPKRRSFYAQVWVYRLTEDGSPAFPVVRVPVEMATGTKPPPGRAYIVSDFLGGSAEAIREANALARYLSRGAFSCSLEGIDLDPEIRLYDTVEVVAVEFRDEGGKTPERYRCRYRYVIDDELSGQISREGHTMTLSGEGFLLEEVRLPKPVFLSGRSRYVFERPKTSQGPLYPSDTLYPSDNLYPRG